MHDFKSPQVTFVVWPGGGEEAVKEVWKLPNRQAVGWCEARTPTLPYIEIGYPTKYPIPLIETLTDQSQNTQHDDSAENSIWYVRAISKFLCNFVFSSFIQGSVGVRLAAYTNLVSLMI